MFVNYLKIQQGIKNKTMSIKKSIYQILYQKTDFKCTIYIYMI